MNTWENKRGFVRNMVTHIDQCYNEKKISKLNNVISYGFFDLRL